jgi:hypothetical protein
VPPSVEERRIAAVLEMGDRSTPYTLQELAADRGVWVVYARALSSATALPVNLVEVDDSRYDAVKPQRSRERQPGAQ